MLAAASRVRVQQTGAAVLLAAEPRLRLLELGLGSAMKMQMHCLLAPKLHPADQYPATNQAVAFGCFATTTLSWATTAARPVPNHLTALSWRRL